LTQSTISAGLAPPEKAIPSLSMFLLLPFADMLQPA